MLFNMKTSLQILLFNMLDSLFSDLKIIEHSEDYSLLKVLERQMLRG